MQFRQFRTVDDLHRAAAAQAAASLSARLSTRATVRLLAATGSSQIPFLEALVATPGIDWSRVELFHLDEYVGLADSHPASFARFIRERLAEPAGIGHVHLINGCADPEAEVARLERELARAPIDLAFVGIGENGHLAFNEPPAQFETNRRLTVVDLDEVSRRQQVGEGWFTTLDDVPKRAITLTIPAILSAGEILCIVYGARKARAVAACFNGPPHAMAPASILATHPCATIFLDAEAASGLRLSAATGT
jgi:glucosamine-6-phosphate deaminase